MTVSVIQNDEPAVINMDYSTDQSNSLFISAYPLENSEQTGFEFEYWLTGTLYPWYM